MNTKLSQPQNYLVRTIFIGMNEVNNALDLVECHSKTSDSASSVILICRRALTAMCNDLSEKFGSEWPENQE